MISARERHTIPVNLGDIRGFNYMGSWGTSGLDLWQHHDHGSMAVEVARGKKYVPSWNVARWWLSHEAYQREPERFLANFEAGLSLFSSHDIRVFPVLFNRWRDPVCDWGGVSLDRIVPELGNLVSPDGFGDGPSLDPGVGESLSSDDHPRTHMLFRDYVEAVVTPHGDDQRILMWDICNEPLAGVYGTDPNHPARRAELRWLEWTAGICRDAGATQPITVGHLGDLERIKSTEPFCDILSFHCYYYPGKVGGKVAFEGLLDTLIAFAGTVNKGIFTSETVWGAVDDLDRADLLRYTLGELQKRSLGFIAHALNHSLVADLHSVGFGPVSFPGRLEFINADGSLRTGHDAFNDFDGSLLSSSAAELQ